MQHFVSDCCSNAQQRRRCCRPGPVRSGDMVMAGTTGSQGRTVYPPAGIVDPGREAVGRSGSGLCERERHGRKREMEYWLCGRHVRRKTVVRWRSSGRGRDAVRSPLLFFFSQTAHGTVETLDFLGFLSLLFFSVHAPKEMVSLKRWSLSSLLFSWIDGLFAWIVFWLFFFFS